MLPRLLVAAVIGAIALSPITSAQNSSYGSYGNQQSSSCYDLSGLPIYTKFPLPDGFPYITPGSPQDTDSVERSGGTRPNYLPSKPPSADTIISLRLATQYEYYSVAVLTQVLEFITERRPGFDISNTQESQSVIQELSADLAQGEQHALAGIFLLEYYGQQVEQPCQYQLPYFTTNDYTSYSYTFSLLLEVYLGFSQTLIQRAAQAGDIDYIPWFVAVHQNIAQRGGVLRSILGYPPSGNPFPAAISREAAYSVLLQLLIVPGSCPAGDAIDLEYYDVLYLEQQPLECGDVDQVINLRARSSDIRSLSDTYVVYNNQQNLPVVVPIQDPQVRDGCVYFSAVFPCSLTTFGRGFTAVGLTDQPGPFNGLDGLVPTVFSGITAVYRD